MCGICGIVLPPNAGRAPDERTLVRMRDTLTHRGPDGAGLFLDDGIGFGHRRLSIVDVAHGHQPMAGGAGALQIVYNGEVFNHPTLQRELEQKGVRYDTHCDTETVLHLFEREGERTPTLLRGMFAFAVWDRRTRELFIARDRYGVKPLYYAHLDDGSLYFASEIKAILAAGAVRASVNMGMLPDYLANHAPSGDETMYEGIRRLPPGHSLRWKDGRITIARYWDVSFDPAREDTRSDAAIVEEYGERLREAVRLRLMADVPLGTFLSGGIDSAAITAIMSQLIDEPVKTFSVAFAEREANELAYARMVAEKFRTDHHEIVVSPEEFFGALPQLVWHEDEPIAHPSSIALNFVSRLASQHVKVVLTGEGSDETLAGYERYRTTVYNLGAGQMYERLVPGALRRTVRRGVHALPASVPYRHKIARTFLGVPADLDSIYLDNFAVFGRERQAGLLSAASRERLAGINPYAAYHAAFEKVSSAPLLNRMLYADVKTYLHELLMKQDQMSMAASIESRVPFLDHPLTEFVATLPQRMKLRGLTTKYVLRQAMTGVLPEEILSRKKMGFPVPVGAWFRGRYKGVLDEYVLGARARERGLFDERYVRTLVDQHVGATHNHSERLWALVNFELWQRIYIDGEGADTPLIGVPAAAARVPAALAT
jgi:asparagine synthase (glutamine-hydrolysing)